MLCDKIIEDLVDVDDFRKEFRKTSFSTLLKDITSKRNRKDSLSQSEIIAIRIAFHNSHFTNFKHFYVNYVCLRFEKNARFDFLWPFY